jgi:hypothetical protein
VVETKGGDANSLRNTEAVKVEAARRFFQQLLAKDRIDYTLVTDAKELEKLFKNRTSRAVQPLPPHQRAARGEEWKKKFPNTWSSTP